MGQLHGKHHLRRFRLRQRQPLAVGHHGGRHGKGLGVRPHHLHLIPAGKLVAQAQGCLLYTSYTYFSTTPDELEDTARDNIMNKG